MWYNLNTGLWIKDVYRLSYIFTIHFSDKQPLEIDDIIDFEDDQMDQISRIASQHTQIELDQMEYGIDLDYLTEDVQKPAILAEKEIIVGSLSSRTLYERRLVRQGKHSLKRIFERVGSDSESTIIGIIDKVKLTNTVQKGQFKGYPQLSYTLRMDGDPDRYKISTSFVKIKSGDRIIKVVTVSNVQTSELSGLGQRRYEQRLGRDPKLEEMFKRIKEQYKKDWIYME